MSSSSETPLPKVCVIVVHYMGEELTRECLKSLKKSNYTELEIILVDNNSPDRAGERLHKEFPGTGFIKLEENRGYTGGANAGFRVGMKGEAKYILLLNNDTVCEPDMIPNLVEAGEDNPGAGMLSPKILYFEPKDHIWYAGGSYSLYLGRPHHYRKGKPEREKTGAPKKVTYLTGCAPMIKREALEETGLLDESLFHIAEDLDLCLRMKKAEYDLIYVPEARLYHKESIATIKKFGSDAQLYLATRNMLTVHRKHSRFYHDIIFYPWFTVRWFLYQSIKHLAAGRPKMIKSLIHAGSDFLKGKPGPPEL